MQFQLGSVGRRGSKGVEGGLQNLAETRAPAELHLRQPQTALKLYLAPTLNPNPNPRIQLDSFIKCRSNRSASCSRPCRRITL